MKQVYVEKGITIGLENMPDDCKVYCLTDNMLVGYLRVAVISGFLMGASVMALGLFFREVAK